MTQARYTAGSLPATAAWHATAPAASEAESAAGTEEVIVGLLQAALGESSAASAAASSAAAASPAAAPTAALAATVG